MLELNVRKVRMKSAQCLVASVVLNVKDLGQYGLEACVDLLRIEYVPYMEHVAQSEKVPATAPRLLVLVRI